MSLKQSSKEPASSRDAALDRVPACWQRERNRDCLRVEAREGESLLLPYQHFVSAHLQQQGEWQVLSVTFSSHQITLEGRHFEEIVPRTFDAMIDVGLARLRGGVTPLPILES